MKRLPIRLAPVLAAAVLAWTALGARSGSLAGLESSLQQHYHDRAAALLTGDLRLVAAAVDQSVAAGRWLLQREQEKAAHLHDWARARGYRFVDSRVEVRPLRLQVAGDTARATVIFRLALGYRPQGDPDAPTDWLGVGTSHTVRLVRSGTDWQVGQDYALDPLHEQGPPPGAALGTAAVPAAAARPSAAFQPEAAAAYADRYCGIAWGCGNGHRYNQAYRDFTGPGGDCANFASQVLVAGGLRPGGGWRYDPRRREGSTAWVNAGNLVHHLIHAGRGRLVARGPFARVVAAAGGPGLGRLAAGDIIAYERGGDIVHVSVVAGSNSQGYTVVNSHTADRFHVPWDLGWGRDTRFWLVAIGR